VSALHARSMWHEWFKQSIRGRCPAEQIMFGLYEKTLLELGFDVADRYAALSNYFMKNNLTRDYQVVLEDIARIK
jgi:hypothetical protein